VDDGLIEGETVVDRPVEGQDLIGDENSKGGGSGGGEVGEIDLVGECVSARRVVPEQIGLLGVVLVEYGCGFRWLGCLGCLVECACSFGLLGIVSAQILGVVGVRLLMGVAVVLGVLVVTVGDALDCFLVVGLFMKKSTTWLSSSIPAYRFLS
jgi:hypothetical protein